MESRMFDEVTKALATPNSRREALRSIGGILGGTALAGLFPGLALADNSACAHWCNSIFEGAARGQCKSDAAHGTGLCYTCGPASPNGTQPICCPTNPDGTCTSYSSATCCSGGQTCQSGTCAATCVVLANGTSVQPCDLPPGSACPSCGVCIPGGPPNFPQYCSTGRNPNIIICANGDTDCPTGQFCSSAGLCYFACPC